MEKLPTEVVAQILSYLTWPELKTARLVCSFWYELSHNLISMKCGITADDLIKICSDEFQNWLILKKIAFNTVSTRSHINTKAKPEEFEKLLNIFHPKTKQITLDNNYLSVEQFKFVIERCPNLECLGLLSKRYQEAFLETESIAELTQLKPLTKLSKFQFKSKVNGYQTGNVFQLLTNLMPNVEHVEIKISPFERFNENTLSECVQVLQHFIKNVATKLKVLKFSGWDLSVLEKCIMTSSLNLRGLDIVVHGLTHDIDDDWRIIETLIKKFKLEHFRLENVHFEREFFKNLIRNLKNLKMLHLDCCFLGGCSLEILGILENLEHLELNNNFISTVYDDVAKAFLCTENYKLKSLTLTGTTFGETESFYGGLHNIKNLTELHLNSPDLVINDNCFQQIICNLKKLKSLKISGTGQITDAAVFDECDANRCISSLSNLEQFILKLINSSSCKFSDMAVYEFLKLKHLKSLVLPQSEMISEPCHMKLSELVYSYTMVGRKVNQMRGPAKRRKIDPIRARI